MEMIQTLYFHIQRMPGNIPGAFASFKTELENTFRMSNSKHLTIKVSGDGTKMSFFVIEDSSCKNSLDQIVFVIAKCSENYADIKSVFRPIFN